MLKMRLEWRQLEKIKPPFKKQELEEMKEMQWGWRGGSEYVSFDCLSETTVAKEVFKVIDVD